jgi:osmotically-inducible protein OsmY
VDLSRRNEFQLTPASKAAFDDLTMTARVQAALITSQKTRNVVLNVRSEAGRVSLSGILADPELEKEVVRVAKTVPGVVEVVTDIEPPPMEYMHP